MFLSAAHFLMRLVVVVLLLAGSMVRSTPAGVSSAACPVVAYDSYTRPDFKIRKLHLARPDLIPYPISVEAYC